MVDDAGIATETEKSVRRLVIRQTTTLAAIFAAVGLSLLTASAHAVCVGDCGGRNSVRINDLVVGVNIALGLQPVTNCEAFANDQGKVTVSQLIQGVNNSLRGCPPADTPTANCIRPNAKSNLTATWRTGV